MNNVRCQFESHYEKKITAVCMDNNCDKMRLCCYLCKGQFHQGHFDKIVEIEQIDDFIQMESPKLIKFSQQYCHGSNQIMKGLEQLSNLIDNFQKIIKEKLGQIKQQNLSEYLKFYCNEQQGSMYWSQFIEGMLKHVEAKNGSIIIKNKNDAQLSKLEVRSIQCISKSYRTIKEIIQSLKISVQTKQLQFQTTPIEMVGHQNTVSQVVLSQDGSLIASGSEDNTVILWDVKKKTSSTIQNNSKVYCVAISSNNQRIAFSDSNKSINLYDLESKQRQQVSTEHTDTIRCIIFSQDNKYLLSGGTDNQLLIWSVQDNKKIYCFKTDSYIESIVMSRDNKLVSCICFDGGTICIWDFQNKTKLIKKDCTHSVGFGLCSSVDSSIFISSGADGIIKIWKLNDSIKNQITLTLTQSIQAANKSIDKVILTPDELYIISSCNQQGQIMVHEMETGKMIQVLETTKSQQKQLSQQFSFYSFISVSNDMNILVKSNYLDMTFRVWTRE